MKIAIVGSGVIGLSVACRLADRGHQISIVSGQPPAQTTSAVAAAYWGPYFVGKYDRVWAEETWHELFRLASDPQLGRESGTTIVDFREWISNDDIAEVQAQLSGVPQASKDPEEISISDSNPYWWRDLPGIDFQLASLATPQAIDLPDLGRFEFTSELRFRSVVARMPDYLRFLQEKAEATGRVTFRNAWIDGFDDLLKRFDFVVNCTGWGAKRLSAEDPATSTMRLLAALVVRVEAPEQHTAFSLGHGLFAKEPLYIIPRYGSQVDSICGGTAIEILGDIDPRLPFPVAIDQQCERIYRRCTAASGAIGSGTRCENLAGLRPMRKSVRIEYDTKQERLIHCYGHGGSGLTLSWGSAGRVVQLVHERGAA